MRKKENNFLNRLAKDAELVKKAQILINSQYNNQKTNTKKIRGIKEFKDELEKSTKGVKMNDEYIYKIAQDLVRKVKKEKLKNLKKN
jgi:hypothetical protein